MLWLKFARRYMFSPKSHSVINIIASVSVVAVAVPTAAMVILLAMFGGLSATIDDLYASVDADIEIRPTRGQTFNATDIDIEQISKVEGVADYCTYLEQSVMLSAHNRRTTVTLRGVDSTYFEVLPLQRYVTLGALNSIRSGDIMLGYSTAAAITAYGIGTRIDVYAMNRKQLSTLLPTGGVSHSSMPLGGHFSSNAEIDSSLAIADIGCVQRLLNRNGKISAVAISLDKGADPEQVQESLQRVVGANYKVQTRDQKNASINDILNIEKLAILFIGAMIALVATFAITGSVIMLITDKRGDIRTLKAMGAPRGLIRKIFVGEGMLLTSIGTIVGLVIGVGFSLGQQSQGWIKIPGNMVIESYPIDLNIGDVAIVAIVVLGLGLATSLVTVGATLKRNKL